MPHNERVASRLAEKYGPDKVLPVSEFTLNGITERCGKPDPNPRRATVFFQLPKSIKEYPLGGSKLIKG